MILAGARIARQLETIGPRFRVFCPHHFTGGGRLPTFLRRRMFTTLHCQLSTACDFTARPSRVSLTEHRGVMAEQRLGGAIAEDLRAIYERRLGERNRVLQLCTARDRRVADARLAAFVACIVLGILVYRGVGIHPGWLAVPGVILVALVLCHEPIRRAGDRARRAVQFYSTAWRGWTAGGPARGPRGSNTSTSSTRMPPTSTFSAWGRCSSVCARRTRAGEETLAAWLLAPATPAVIRERHAAITELRPGLDLREDLELLGVEIRAGIDPAALAAWGTSTRAFPGPAVPIAATVLGALGTAALVGWAFFDTGLLPVLVVLSATGLFARAVSGRVRGVLAAVDQRTHDLVLLSELLRRLEARAVRGPAASALGPFARDRPPPGFGTDPAAGAAAPASRLSPQPALHAGGRGVALDHAARRPDRRLAQRVWPENRAIG